MAKISASEVYHNWGDFESGQFPETDVLSEILLEDTDRGCLLASTAFLDDLLKERIWAKLKEMSGIGRDDLEFLLTKRPLPPLGSYGVRVVMARALGLIDPTTRNTLKAIQDLRNKKAHSWDRFAFSDDDVREIQKTLTQADFNFVDYMGNRHAESIAAGKKPKVSEARRRYCALVLRTTHRVMESSAHKWPVPEPKDMKRAALLVTTRAKSLAAPSGHTAANPPTSLPTQATEDSPPQQSDQPMASGS